MRVALASFTAAGSDLAEWLCERLRADGHTAAHTALHGVAAGCGLREWTAARFAAVDALVFVGAVGIAVRAVAPHLQSKLTDPAVVSVDERGLYAVPLVAGHVGGANDLARLVASYCGGVAVISTATDLRGVFAVDCWAAAQGLRIANPEAIRRVSGKLLAGKSIVIASDQPIMGEPPAGVRLDREAADPDVVIGWRAADPGASRSTLRLIPPALAVGIGCRRDASEAAIGELYERMLDEQRLLPAAVFTAATIDRKAEEPGLLAFCARRGLPLATYPAKALAAVPGAFTASAFVRSVTGVDNVCERAAVLAARGELLVSKQCRDGVTMAVAVARATLSFSG